MTTIAPPTAAHWRLVIIAIAAIALSGALVLVTSPPGSDTPVPITPTLLAKAARAADTNGDGYDYACQINAPRQLLCQGQGTSVMFLITPTGQLQLEPGSGQ